MSKMVNKLEEEKNRKNLIFIIIIIICRQKRKEIIFPQFCHLRRLVFDQSSPVHSVSESRVGTVSVNLFIYQARGV